MAKAFFITFVILILGGIGCVFLNGLGFLPAPVYSFLYVAGNYIPFMGNTIPYLEKFEGNWDVVLTPGQDSKSDIATCNVIEGLVHVHNGTFTGNIGPAGARLPFTASTTEQGVLSGTFGGVTVHNGILNVTLEGKNGVGNWSDNYGCGGTAQFTKQDNVIDPTVARVISAKGDVQLIRPDGSEPLTPGMMLYVGDEIQTGEGVALLGVGQDFSNPVSIPTATTYKVPR